jgi:predicted deacylase
LSEIFEVGTLKLDRGKKAAGHLPIAARGDGTSIGLPLLAAVGLREGPTLVISGGVHGDEYEGPCAIQRLWRQLDPAELRGVFLGVPVVNVPAFQDGTRESPIDGFDLNRTFPGRENGFISEMIAHRFLVKVVLKADYYVDLHAGGNAFAMAPTVVYLETGPDEFKAREIALAKAAGVDLLWKGKGLWAAAHVEAVKRGIPAILAEIGQEGRCAEPAVKLGEQIMMNVMKHANMINGVLQLPQEWIIVEGTYMQSRTGGCFYPSVDLKQRVQSGDTVGLITDLYGDTIETISAPFDGIVVSTRTFPSIRPGERTTFVGSVLKTIAG